MLSAWRRAAFVWRPSVSSQELLGAFQPLPYPWLSAVM